MDISLHNSIDLTSVFPQHFQLWQKTTDLGTTNVVSVQKEQYKAYVERWKQWYDALIKEQHLEQQFSFLEFVRSLYFGFSDSELELLAQKEPTPEHIVYLIGAVTARLKMMIQVLKSKRHALRYTFIKKNLSKNKFGLESVIREILLRKYTKQSFEPTRIPLLPFHKLLPEFIEAVNSFNVKIEELYTTYTKGEPTSKDILFDPIELYNRDSNLFSQSIGTDAIHVKADFHREDDFGKSFSLKFEEGNNWFYFPEGKNFEKINSLSEPKWEPIPLSESKLIESGATAGLTWQEADRIFFQTSSGAQGGAWLKKNAPIYETKIISTTLPAHQTREFCFPYPGFQLKKNEPIIFTLTHSDRDSYYYLTEIASNELHQKLFSDYWKTPLPPTASEPLYLNSTTLRDIGTPGPTILEADTIEIRDHPQTLEIADKNLYYGTDIKIKKNKMAYLYEFKQTDLFIQKGENFLVWPVYSKNAEDQPYKHQAWTKKDCVSLGLASLGDKQIIGSVAGLVSNDLQHADRIFKLSKYDGKEDDAIDAAWLASGSVADLICKNTIPVYDEKDPPKPQFCQQYIEGPIQSSLAFKCNPQEKVSFIWCGPDTYADEVFFFREHSEDCPYKNFRLNSKQTEISSLSLYFSVGDYYNNQNFLNPSVESALEKLIRWEGCTCKSTHFSPIGHIGQKYHEYNGICDLLFVDPQGYGEHFIENSWRDTRGYTVNDSPQFAFYQLNKSDANADTPIGFGPGTWRTSAGTRMVLKTGFRYTYFRTSLRTDYELDRSFPPFYARYVYPSIDVRCDLGCYDLVIVLDLSRSLQRDLVTIQQIAAGIVDYVLDETSNKVNEIQVGLVAFDYAGVVASYLTQDKQALKTAIYSLFTSSTFPKYLTNLKSGLSLARHILFDTITTGPIGEGVKRFNDLCSNLLNYIQATRRGKSINRPQDCGKKIVLISDGIDTSEEYLNFNGNIQTETLFDIVEDLKKRNTDIITVEIGPQSNTEGIQSLLPQIASRNKRIDAEAILFQQGNNEKVVIQKVLGLLNDGCPVRTPTWCKMYRNQNGEWVKTLEPSDMVLQPGDCLLYKHSLGAIYNIPELNLSFQTPAVDFAINVNLGGWNYEKKVFDELLYKPGQKNIGARPFWGKVSTEEGGIERFVKSCYGLGGFVRWTGDLVPLKQPPICQEKIYNGNHLLYTNKSSDSFIWKQPTPLVHQDPAITWCDLYISPQDFKTVDITDPQNFGIFPSNEPTQIQLQDVLFSEIIRWNYFAKKPFIWNFRARPLYSSQDPIKQIKITDIKASDPWLHRHTQVYPSFPLDRTEFISKNSSVWTAIERPGPLLRPDVVGTSYYNNSGFAIQISRNRLIDFYYQQKISEYILPNINGFFIPYQQRWLFINSSRLTPIEIVSFIPFDFINYDICSPVMGSIINDKNDQTFSGYRIEKNEFTNSLPILPKTFTCTHFIQDQNGVILSLYKNLSGEPLLYKQQQIPGALFVSYSPFSSAQPLSSALPELYDKYNWPSTQLFTHIENSGTGIRFHTTSSIYYEILTFNNKKLVVSDHINAILSTDNQTASISFASHQHTKDYSIEWASKVQIVPPHKFLISLYELVDNRHYVLRDQVKVDLPFSLINLGTIQNSYLNNSSFSINQISKDYFISILFTLEYTSLEKHQYQMIVKYRPESTKAVVVRI